MRACPVCGAFRNEVIYRSVVSCTACGMVFDMDPQPVDYCNESLYAFRPETENDRNRHRDTVCILAGAFPKFKTVLDIGCARGGLLDALEKAGHMAVGMDPSPQCVETCRSLGLNAVKGSLPLTAPAVHPVDVITMSQVLEHIADPVTALRSLRCQGMYLYVDVPDAERYTQEMKEPYFQFSNEHINHFSRVHLLNVLEQAGWKVIEAGTREFSMDDKNNYPAIYAAAKATWQKTFKRDSGLTGRVREYAQASQEKSERLNELLKMKLWRYSKVIIWGAGQCARMMLRECPVLKTKTIALVVDASPIRQNSVMAGMKVYPPAVAQTTSPEIPILIASYLAKNSILEDIRKAGLKNPVIEV